WLECFVIYEEEIGFEYPFLDPTKCRSQLRASTSNTDGCDDANTTHTSLAEIREKSHFENIATLILALVATLAEPEAAEIAMPVVLDIYGPTITKGHLSSLVEDEFIVLMISSIFFFNMDKATLAWRGTGMVLRLLHEGTNPSSYGIRVKPTTRPNPHVNELLYWSAYNLDRRWSFCTGLPFAVQDSEINRRPEFTDGSIVSGNLSRMVEFYKIVAAIRRWILGFPISSPTTAKSTHDLLQSQLSQWYEDLPDNLRLDKHRDNSEVPANGNRGEHKLRLMLYLRANQMRTAIYRAFAIQFGLHSLGCTGIGDMVDISRDTIRVLAGLVHSPAHHTRDTSFSHFFDTALSSLLLAMCLTGSLRSISSSPITPALGAIRHLSTQSPTRTGQRDKWKNLQYAMNDIEAQ
ncbi:hypothetical protein B0T10DRAFT_375332, partial [Thelonectria olida]